MTGPGKPTETRSYFQPAVCALIAFIMTSGVIFGLDGTLTISSCCCVRNFRLVPPISTPKIFMPPPERSRGCLFLLRELRHPTSQRLPYIHDWPRRGENVHRVKMSRARSESV